MTDAEVLARLRLARTEGVGPLTFRRLLTRFDGALNAIPALPDLARSSGAAPFRVASIDSAEREMESLARIGARLLVFGADAYPPLLAQIEDAPPALAVRGDLAVLSTRSVGMVGARNASANGQRMAEALATELTQAGLVVVSGMARGIDAAAHTGAMHTGRTVAAVAGGLDMPYPPENAELQRRIAERGAVVAEAPLGTAPQARHFPKRNRIIAGLSLGVVVVEAALRSGSLITANLAHDYGRGVFAVPGSPLDPRCRGSNDLLRREAHLTESAADVLEHLSDPAPPTLFGLAEEPPILLQSGRDIDQATDALLELLGPSPTDVDDLVRRCQFSASAVLTALLTLELNRRVEMLPGNRVALLVEPGNAPP